MRRIAGIALALLLAGCGAAAGAWTRPGADQAAVARDDRDCRAQADRAFAADRSIDADIMASRGADWQRAGTLEPQRGTMRRQAGEHAETVFAACMRAKGYTRQAKPG